MNLWIKLERNDITIWRVSIHEHGIFLHLFRSWISVISVLQFSVYSMLILESSRSLLHQPFLMFLFFSFFLLLVFQLHSQFLDILFRFCFFFSSLCFSVLEVFIDLFLSSMIYSWPCPIYWWTHQGHFKGLVIVLRYHFHFIFSEFPSLLLFSFFFLPISLLMLSTYYCLLSTFQPWLNLALTLQAVFAWLLACLVIRWKPDILFWLFSR